MNTRTTWENVWQRFYSKTRRAESGCLLWTGAVRGDGYGAFTFGGQQIGAARMAWLLNRGEIPEGLHVLHRCDNPLCVDHEHLFIGTVQDNVDDMIAKGRKVVHRGEEHWSTLLTEADVQVIRSSDDTGVKLAARYKISTSTVSLIRNRRTWRHL
jgi:hypothetical protein